MALPSTNRRSFLQTTSAVALTAASYARVRGANERVGVGVIGYGLIAKTHVATFRKLDDVEFVAVAECHKKRLTEGVASEDTVSNPDLVRPVGLARPRIKA